jgi:hypothetical protein
LINFKPFQALYQQVKKTDSKLFEAFGTISSYLQSLGTASDNLSTLGLTANLLIASANGQSFTNVFVTASGLTFIFPKAGKWLITLSAQILQVSPDTSLQLKLLISGTALSRLITADNGGAGVIPTATYSATNKWSFQAHGGETVTVQIAKGGGAGASTLSSNSVLTAIWINP